MPFFRHVISDVSAGPMVTKLCHMFGGDCNYSIKIGSQIWGVLSLPKIWRHKSLKISPRFWITSRRRDREYLQHGIRCRASVNGVANYDQPPIPVHAHLVWRTLTRTENETRSTRLLLGKYSLYRQYQWPVEVSLCKLAKTLLRVKRVSPLLLDNWYLTGSAVSVDVWHQTVG